MGICIGMQMMASLGREYEDTPGFGWIPGEVVPIAPADPSLKVPHMGWNDLVVSGNHPCLEGVETGDHAYFVHSFHLRPEQAAHRLAYADYGTEVTAIVGEGTRFGTQFHPEKSQQTGLRIIANFLAVGPVSAAIGWSSGKDATFALMRAREAGHEVTVALTTINEAFDRVAMHGTRAAILRAQAAAADLELMEVALPWPCPNETYEARMAEAVARLTARGITHMIFGDLFLEDVRAYREAQLEGSGITPLFPLWGADTAALAAEMAATLDTRIVTLDPSKLPEHFAGRRLDAALLAELSEGIDPCGENGEFHTCVLDAPCFHAPIPATRGETVTRDGFVYSDLVL